jgi:hypothetical protein
VARQCIVLVLEYRASALEGNRGVARGEKSPLLSVQYPLENLR